MSIPKEPRQLMINLMYLVLTALLALNVSAEVMNAFFDIDKSLAKSADLSLKNSVDTKKGIKELFKGKNEPLKPVIYGAMDEASGKVDAFVDYVENLKDNLIDQTGDKSGANDEGDYDKYHKPKGKKNKDVTTRILITEGEGELLKDRIVSLRVELIEIFNKAIQNEDVAIVGELTPEEISGKMKKFDAIVELTPKSIEDIKATTDKATWSEYKFKQMPLAAILPVLTKFQTDARNAQAVAANEFARLLGGKSIPIDNFFPIMQAKKGYIIKGEKFEGTVSIGASSEEFAKNASISINGRGIPLTGGKGTFTETANSYGKKTLNMVATVTNPITGVTMSGKDEFVYEVGERSASMFLSKMNVFYMGVDNPFEVSVAGAPSNQVKVTASGGGCKISGGSGKYSAKVSTPGDVKINVSAPGLTKTFNIRAKRIPDPMAKLGKNKGGRMANGTFKAQRGLIAALDGFDFDAKCAIQGFEFVRVPQRQDPIVKVNKGGTYSGDVKRLVTQAKPGDIYYFNNVKAKCPGDVAGRLINSLVFKIK